MILQELANIIEIRQIELDQIFIEIDKKSSNTEELTETIPFDKFF